VVILGLIKRGTVHVLEKRERGRCLLTAQSGNSDLADDPCHAGLPNGFGMVRRIPE
jgi:hypothetical protein